MDDSKRDWLDSDLTKSLAEEYDNRRQRGLLALMRAALKSSDPECRAAAVLAQEADMAAMAIRRGFLEKKEEQHDRDGDEDDE